MFTSNQKLYISSKTNAARWRAVSMAVTSFTVLPISLSLWEVMINSDILKLAIYMIFAIIILDIRVIVAGKVAYHTTVVELLRTRLDHPPNSPKELKDDQESTKLTGGS